MIKKYRPNKGLITAHQFKLLSIGAATIAGTTGSRRWLADQITATSRPVRQMENVQAYKNLYLALPDHNAFLFAVSLEHSSDLDLGVIPEAVHQEFRELGEPLSPHAQLIVANSGQIWFIKDQERKYSVRMVPTGLLVYIEEG